jgi:hypothetical protein
MTCKDLIGYQLVFINAEEIIVKKDDKEYTLFIQNDSGDCCGYNDITTELLIDNAEVKRNPIITNVEIDEYEDGCGSKAKLTFFGEYKPIAVVDSYSSSGSGWCYGACVTIECKMLGIDDTLTAW